MSSGALYKDLAVRFAKPLNMAAYRRAADLDGRSRQRQADDSEMPQAHELGWQRPMSYVPVAMSVVRDRILPRLREIGLNLPESGRRRILAPMARAT
jgi:hypothetical protein